MAQATEILAESQLEGASLVLIYDDVTLIGSALRASVSSASVGPMTINIAMNTGFNGTFTVQPGNFNTNFNIPNNRRPQGVLITTQFGTQTIDWGITSCSISFRS